MSPLYIQLQAGVKGEFLSQHWWNNDEKEAIAYSLAPENWGWGYFGAPKPHLVDKPFGMHFGV